jgi:hypothetical protein
MRKLRKESSLPVLMFTSKDNSTSKVRGLRKKIERNPGSPNNTDGKGNRIPFQQGGVSDAPGNNYNGTHSVL